MLVQVGSHEILLDDALRLAATAAAHDVDVKLEVTAGVPHVFYAFADVLDEGKAALRSIGGFLRAHLVDAGTEQPPVRPCRGPVVLSCRRSAWPVRTRRPWRSTGW